MKISFLTITAAVALVASFEVVGVSAGVGCGPKPKDKRGGRGLRVGDYDSNRKLENPCRERKQRSLLRAQKVAKEAKEGRLRKEIPNARSLNVKDKKALLDLFEEKNE